MGACRRLVAQRTDQGAICTTNLSDLLVIIVMALLPDYHTLAAIRGMPVDALFNSALRTTCGLGLQNATQRY